ncbi:MAG: hypothetical protein DIZ80_12050 [endosymbiont of Galathealinum brachiosum]|uniref:POTRA domain-containing protein n=1 Tax=endosymbiont of Galathealinum brachiosum TaxID=2200906 RepID=A0A370DDK7_9GAMM|nr:MAG: hypothetical protein DIZ80_12050 [endosymbiont of Galathealinum brachiosum]
MDKAKKTLWLILVFYSFNVGAVSYINNIKYKGNEVTQPSVLDREIYIEPGDELNERLIEKSRQAIMDTGLFRSVSYYLEENYTDKNESAASLVDIVFVVKEKYYLLIIPRLKIDDNEIHYGLQLKWDNVFGLNHETRIQALNRGNTQGVDETRHSFRYFYPNVNDSSYNLGFSVQRENNVDEIEEIGRFIDRQDDSFRVEVSRWLNERGRNRGYFVGSNVMYQKRFNHDLVIESNSEYLDAIILGLDVGFKDLNNYKYNRGGKEYGYKLDFSHEALSSESEFTKHRFYYRSYYRFADRPASNLNVQVKFGHSNNQVLGEDAFSLGSSNDLRGYEKKRFTGNTKFVTNVEYMFPHADHPVIRYVTFIDAGNTYDALSDVFHEALNIGAGFGLRWKIRVLVKIDLRADVGYGFTDEDYRFSFGTRHAF